MVIFPAIIYQQLFGKVLKRVKTVRGIETLMILAIVCGGAVAYCFIVGEISRNNSQMDKLWSIMPIAYAWIVAAKGDMRPRLVIFAIIVTLWGIRLTVNFARKGAYSIKFWAGEEDYRWQVLRKSKYLSNKVAWAFWDLFFISFYQNVLVLAICLPALAVMSSDAQLYLGEQGVWLSLYFVVLGAGVANYGIFNWTMIGPLFLIFLFLGSSTFGESVSNAKYPEFHIYMEHVSKYVPLWKYNPEKYKE